MPSRWDGAGSVRAPHIAVPVARNTPLPLYEFVKTGAGALPWTAISLAAVDGGATLIAGPRTAVSANGALSVVVFATKAHSVGVVSVEGTSTSYLDLASQVILPPTADAPVPFFDGAGRLNVVYLATSGHIILVVNNASNAVAAFGPASQFRHTSWVVRDLTNATGVITPGGVAVTGEVAAVANGSLDLFAVRTTDHKLVVLSVWNRRPFAVAAVTVVAPSVTISSNPVVVGAPRNDIVTLAAITSTNHLDVFRQITPLSWSTNDLTTTITALPFPMVMPVAAGTSQVMVGRW